MAVTATALADLRFGLRFAASRYRQFAQLDNPRNNADLFLALADERSKDASELDDVSASAGLAHLVPTLSDSTAGFLLGLGSRDVSSATSAAYRVQRAENTLGRIVAQLGSLADHMGLREVLDRIRTHIDNRRDAVREARRSARTSTDSFYAMHRGTSERPEAAQGRQVIVWFATNRRKDNRGRFLGERADHISYGRCRVFVPENRAAGSLGRGLFGRLIWGDNRIKVSSVEQLKMWDFWSVLARDVADLDARDRHGLVFIHGYRTRFAAAAQRTAQLKIDLSHHGPAAFFSWPSLGEAVGYAGDEAAIEGSESAIQEFLVDFAARSNVDAVHIIAHSMGNRGLLRAMNAIANAAASAASIKFGQIFLAAPDVDTQLFQNLAAAYRKLSVRVTLYVTSNDKAIGVSQLLHRAPRAGLTPPVLVLPGIDTIDASHINLGLMGHSYAAEMRPVLADIHRLIQGDTPPDRRFGLRKAFGGDHWEFVP